MTLFLLTFDRRNRRVTVEPIEDQAHVMDRLLDAERRVRDDPELEIVLLTAADEEDLRRTHSRYFDTFGELLERA